MWSKLKITVPVFLLFLSMAGCQRSDLPEQTILAESEISQVTADEFVREYQQYLDQTGLPDQMNIRKSYLEQMFLQSLLLGRAKQAGQSFPADDAEIRSDIDDILVGAVAEHIVKPRIQVTDVAVKERFRQRTTYYHLKQVFAASLEDARFARERLAAGELPDQIVRQITVPSILEDGYRDLGFVSGDNIKPRVLKTISGMRQGEWSEPVQVRTGYTIVQVVDAKRKPLSTEMEFAKMKGDIESEIRREHLRTAASNFVDSLLAAYNLRWNEDTLDELLTYLQLYPFPDSDKSTELMRRQGLDMQDVIAFGESVDFSVGEFLEWSARTSHAIPEQFERKFDLRNFVQGLMMCRALVQIAEKNHLDREPEVHNDINSARYAQQARRIVSAALDTLRISEADLQQYYEANIGDFRNSEQIRLREIVVGNDAKATQLLEALHAGASMEELAVKYTLREAARETGGDLGFAPVDALGVFADDCRKAEVGELIGPLEFRGYYYLLKIIGKRPAEVPSFAKVRSRVREQYISDRRSKLLLPLYEKMTEHYQGRIHWERLTNIELGETNKGVQL